MNLKTVGLEEDITIEKGANFGFVLDVVGGPDTLTGYVAILKIRDRATGQLLGASAPGEIVVNPNTRQVVIRLKGATTAAFKGERGVYGLSMSHADGNVWSLMAGNIRMPKLVTA